MENIAPRVYSAKHALCQQAQPLSLCGGGKRVPTVRPLSFRIYRRCPLQHQNGTVTRISEPVSTSYYRTNCTIQLQLASGKLIARASTDSQYNKSAYPAAVLSKVEMEIPITGTSVGGFGILYNGGAPTVITDLKVEWP